MPRGARSMRPGMISSTTFRTASRCSCTGADMDGIIVVRKERGYTSNDVVAKLRGILRMKKIAHRDTGS